MHRLLTALFVFVLVAFASGACRAADPIPQAFQSGPDENSPLTHRDSAFVFPAQLGGFHRMDPRQYDTAGRDVSVGYYSDAPRVVATIYVYPTGGLSLEKEFARRQAELTSSHSGAELLSSGSTNVTPRKVRALCAEYTFSDRFAGTVQLLRSVVLVAPCGERFVEYRITYPAATQKPSAELIQQLTQDFAWP